MHCPKCERDNKVKAGFNKGKQRYKCKDCGCSFTRSTPKGEPIEKKRQAINFTWRGLDFVPLAGS